MMKRKAAVALTLAALMAVTTIMPVFAADHTLDETDSGPQDFSEDTDDVNVTVAEGHTANVESIDAGSNNLSIGGGGTLNVDAPSGDGISGSSVTISDTNVNISTDEYGAGIRATNDVTINNSDVNIDGGQYGICAIGTATISDSSVTADTKSTSYGHGILGEAGINIINSDVEASVRGEDPVLCGSSINLVGSSVVSGSYAGSSIVISKDASTDTKGSDSCSDTNNNSSTTNNEESSNNTTKTEVTTPVSVIVASVDPVTMGEAAYTSKVTSMITGAPYGGTIEINVTSGAYLNDLIISALETRSDVSLKINVVVDGVPYVLNIPAGFNLRALLGADGKIDLQKLIAAFGTAK